MSRLFFVMVLVFGLEAPLARAADADRSLDGAWFYHRGDLPVPPSAQAMKSGDWSPVASRRTPPGRSEDNVLWLWLRLPLPTGDWRDPTVLLSSVDGAFEAYAGDRLIYRSGVMGRETEENLMTSTWHLVTLAPSDLGHDLTLRIRRP